MNKFAIWFAFYNLNIRENKMKYNFKSDWKISTCLSKKITTLKLKK